MSNTIRPSLRLTEEEGQILKEMARTRGMSINKYIKDRIFGSEDIEHSPTPESEIFTNDIRIKLSKEDRQLLEQKSKAMGLNATDYIKDFIHKKAYVNLTVGISDLHDLLDEINTLSKKLNGTVSVLRSSGIVYEQDVRAIIEIFKSIDTTCNNIYLEERKARYRLYEEARKRLFEDIDSNKINRVKAFPRKKR